MHVGTLKLRHLGRSLLAIGPGGLYWPWLQDEDGKTLRRINKRRANKFLLGCIIDYQVKADTAWASAARLAETELRDPRDLWRAIAGVPRREWLARRNRYLWLHRFPAAHERVWRIARGVRELYAGDARRIWRGQSPGEVRRRLDKLRLGPQLSRMAIGALIDTKRVRGVGDVKADLHVRRVLGRLLRGRQLSEREATLLTRRMYPKNPWKLDSKLFWLGKNVCKAKPLCNRCELRHQCAFFRKRRHG